MKNGQTKHRIRKRVIFLGLSLGLLVNQIMILQANRALAVDIVNPTPITATQHAEINPFDVINKVNQQQTERLQNRQNSNHVINYDTNKPLVNYSNTTQQKNIQTESIRSNIYSGYNQYRPIWKDYAPYGWDNVNKDEKEGTYWLVSKSIRAQKQNYWYSRRKDFEKDLAFCDNLVGNEQISCYENLRNRQERINSRLAQEEQQNFIMQMQRQQLQAQAMANFQASMAQAEENRLRETEMTLKYMPRAPQIQPYSQPRYRVYDQYGRSQGYIQQSNW